MDARFSVQSEAQIFNVLTIGIVAATYFIGSVSFAIIVSRLLGLPDPRSYGSGNPGMANVLRGGSKVAAVLTLAGDALKGWVAVWLAQRFAPVGATECAMAGAGVMAVIGHMFPVFHLFRGGKGVATALGVLLGFNGFLALGAIAAWLLVAMLFRMSSLASVTSALIAPLATAMIFGPAHPFFAGVTMIAVLLAYRHRGNIKDIAAGKERKLGQTLESGVSAQSGLRDQ